MNLKSYYSGTCVSGFDAAMLLVFQAGKALVTTNVIGVAATAIIHTNDLDPGTGTPGPVSIIADTIGVAGNSITFLGDGVKTIAVLAGENGFSIVSGDPTQILENGDTVTLSGGVDAVNNPNTILSSGLAVAALAGKVKFTINVPTYFETSNLRLKGIHLATYLAGIVDEMAIEGIYSPYFTLALNTSDTLATSIDFNFSF